MNKQKMFDTIVEKLHEQGVRSYDTYYNHCVYRGENGAKCAVGHILSDRYYREDMDVNGLNRVKDIVKLGYKLPRYISDNVDFLTNMQKWHDADTTWNDTGFSPKGIKGLYYIAKMHNLDDSIVSKIDMSIKKSG